MISVVIPIFKRAESVLTLLRDIYAQESVNFEVILIDDCSPDDTASIILNTFPHVKMLRNSANSGPAVSRNRGIRAATGDIIIGLDSDVTIPDNNLFLKVLKLHKQHPSVTCFAFRILDPITLSDDNPRWCHPGACEDYGNRIFESTYFSGTGYSMRRKEILATPLFPEWLYMDYEEVEFAFRILDAGGTIVHHPALAVVHHQSPVAERNKIEDFYRPRNQILVTITCYPFIRGTIYITPRVLRTSVKCICRWGWGDLLRILSSAASLAPLCLKNRTPLKPQTWRRIREITRHSRPCAIKGIESAVPSSETS